MLLRTDQKKGIKKPPEKEADTLTKTLTNKSIRREKIRKCGLLRRKSLKISRVFAISGLVVCAEGIYSPPKRQAAGSNPVRGAKLGKMR